jgi:hypothetical protein
MSIFSSTELVKQPNHIVWQCILKQPHILWQHLRGKCTMAWTSADIYCTVSSIISQCSEQITVRMGRSEVDGERGTKSVCYFSGPMGGLTHN